MLINRRRLRVCYTLVLLFVCSLRVHAQTIEDGIMMGKGELQVGNLYSHDSWDEYWEGTLSRRNANIGSITTTTNTWSANYGLTDTLNVIGMVPYIWTRASQGRVARHRWLSGPHARCEVERDRAAGRGRAAARDRGGLSCRCPSAWAARACRGEAPRISSPTRVGF